jgi:hypothetical protein
MDAPVQTTRLDRVYEWRQPMSGPCRCRGRSSTHLSHVCPFLWRGVALLCSSLLFPVVQFASFSCSRGVRTRRPRASATTRLRASSCTRRERVIDRWMEAASDRSRGDGSVNLLVSSTASRRCQCDNARCRIRNGVFVTSIASSSVARRGSIQWRT